MKVDVSYPVSRKLRQGSNWRKTRMEAESEKATRNINRDGDSPNQTYGASR